MHYVSAFTVEDGVLVGYSGDALDLRLPDGIRAIGACAFTSFDHENRCLRRSNVRSISIPNTVVSIDENAFSDCVALENISVDAGDPVYYCTDGCLIETNTKTLIRGTPSSKIPPHDEVTSIAAHAFAFCESLRSIDIPEGVTKIGTSAFGDCTALQSVTLPSSLSKLGLTVFGGCDELKSIIVAADNPVYRSYDGCIVDIAAKKLVQGSSYCTIPSDGSVEIIGERAFCLCRRLRSLAVPECVKLIEREAFDQCPLLTDLHIPQSTTVIASEAQYTEKQRFMKAFGKRLKAARKRKGLTQEQVMALTDITDKSLSRYENGSSAPSPDVISELMRLYGVSADHLMGCTDAVAPTSSLPCTSAPDDADDIMPQLCKKLGTLSKTSLRMLSECVDMLKIYEELHPDTSR